MIITLNGLVAEKLGEMVVLETQGVGYGVLMTAEDYGLLQIGKNAKLYIHDHIRENTHDLFGFVGLDTRNLFEQLLEVSGVGPRMALSILSIGPSSDVRQAIAGGDVKYLQAASGVGKRVAERVVVELKDKVGLSGVELAGTGLLQTDGILRQDEAVEALVALGFSPQDAARALAGIDKKLATEERVRQALKAGK